ncbi:MAG: phosphate ABC transporter ATP-binding protein, partial [Cyanobacteria bacterium J06632_22]
MQDIRVQNATQTVTDMALKAEKVSVYYGSNLAVKDVYLDIPRNKVIAFIGPSGCGKS